MISKLLSGVSTIVLFLSSLQARAADLPIYGYSPVFSVPGWTSNNGIVPMDPASGVHSMSFDDFYQSVPFGTVLIDRAGTRFYVLEGDWISVIDIATKQTLKRISIDAGTRAFRGVLSLDGGQLFAISSENYGIYVIDTNSLSVKSVIDAASANGEPSIDRSGRFIYYRTTSASVVVVDVKAHQKRLVGVAPGFPSEFEFHPDGRRAFALAQNDSIAVIDVGSMTVTSTVKVGRLPSQSKLSFDGRRLYVRQANGILVLDTDSMQPVTTITDVPSGRMVFDQGGQRILVENFSRLPISVIDVASNSLAVPMTAPRFQYNTLLVAGGPPIVNSEQAVGDFNGDGKADILWQNTATGDRYVWFMNGALYAGDANIGNVPPEWKIVARGDFNRDGQTDLLWHNATTGAVYIWYMRGTAYLSDRYVGHLPSPWSVGAAADFNGDGQLDVVLQNRTDGSRWFWYLNEGAYTSGMGLGTVAPEWVIAGAADFDADGKADIVWENTATGQRYLWKMDGSTYLEGVNLGSYGTDLQIASVGDVNGDGKPDLVWQDTATGARYVWYMDGARYSSGAYLGTVPPIWSIVR